MGIGLNLGNANSFEKLPIGTYDSVVYDAEIKDPKDSKLIDRPVPENAEPGSLGKMWVNDKGEEKFQNLNVQFKVDNGEHDNRRAFRMYNLGPKSQGFLIKFLENIGHREFQDYKLAYEEWMKGGSQGDPPADFQLDHTGLPGYKCRIVIKHEPDKREGHKGELQERVADVLPPGDGESGEAATPGPWL